VAADPPAADKRGSRPDEPGATFISQTQGVRLSPYKPATELPASALEGRLMRLPLYCGKPPRWQRKPDSAIRRTSPGTSSAS
jgi:hypothetical protein